MYALSTAYCNPMSRRRAYARYTGEDFLRPLMRMAESFMAPGVNVRETDDAHILSMELPGFEPSEINVSVQDGELTLDAEHAVEGEGEENTARREVHRRYQLSNVVEDGITAAYKNGILSVTLPKQPEPEAPPARRIEIAG